jgi:DSF synthase
MSSQLYTADVLHQLGLVDVLVDDGQGDAVLDALVRGPSAARGGRPYAPAHRDTPSAATDEVIGEIPADYPRARGMRAALQARRMAFPLSHESLVRVVDYWAETALTLTDRDLRLMERLARAQMHRANGIDHGARWSASTC